MWIVAHYTNEDAAISLDKYFTYEDAERQIVKLLTSEVQKAVGDKYDLSSLTLKELEQFDEETKALEDNETVIGYDMAYSYLNGYHIDIAWTEV